MRIRDQKVGSLLSIVAAAEMAAGSFPAETRERQQAASSIFLPACGALFDVQAFEQQGNIKTAAKAK